MAPSPDLLDSFFQLLTVCTFRRKPLLSFDNENDVENQCCLHQVSMTDVGFNVCEKSKKVVL